MKIQKLVFISLSLLLLSSLVLAQRYVTAPKGTGRVVSAMMITPDLKSYLKEHADYFVVIDPTTLKQLSRQAVKTASDDTLGAILSSPHNTGTLRSVYYAMIANQKFPSASMKAGRRQIKQKETAQQKQTKTMPAPLMRERMKLYDVYSTQSLITDAQLDRVIQQCAGLKYQGTFYNVIEHKGIQFYRFKNEDGTLDRDILRRIIAPGRQQNVCVNKALR